MNNEVKTINGYAIKDVKAVRTYDTVALLKADRKLKQGQHVKTRGYYSNGDGGSAEYYITNTQSESEYQENLENGLYATLIINNSINTRQFGCKGDNETNETNKLKAFFNTKANTYFINEGQYIIDDNLDINSNSIIKGDKNSVIKFVGDSEDYFMLNVINKNNVSFENVHLIGNRTSHQSDNLRSGFGFNIMFSQNITIRDCIAEDLWCDGFYIGNSFHEEQEQETKNVFIQNCKSIECGRNGFVVGGGKNITIDNCYCYKAYRLPGSGIDIEPEGAEVLDLYAENIRINNFTSEECEYGISLYSANTYIKNCIITNHISLNDNKGESINITNTNSSVEFIGSNIVNSRDVGVYVYGVKAPNSLLIKDLIIDGTSSNHTNTDLSNAGILLYGLNNESDNLDNITIDNVTYKNTNSDYDYYYLISQQHFHLSSLLLKNTLRLANQPKIAIYNYDKIDIENCIIIEDGTTMTLGRYNIFNKMLNNNSLSGINNLVVSDLIPNGIYEVYYTNNTVTNTAGLQFNNNLTVYQGNNQINNLVYTYKKCSYCRFMKNETDVLILDTSMTTTNV